MKNVSVKIIAGLEKEILRLLNQDKNRKKSDNKSRFERSVLIGKKFDMLFQIRKENGVKNWGPYCQKHFHLCYVQVLKYRNIYRNRNILKNQPFDTFEELASAAKKIENCATVLFAGNRLILEDPKTLVSDLGRKLSEFESIDKNNKNEKEERISMDVEYNRLDAAIINRKTELSNPYKKVHDLYKDYKIFLKIAVKQMNERKNINDIDNEIKDTIKKFMKLDLNTIKYKVIEKSEYKHIGEELKKAA